MGRNKRKIKFFGTSSEKRSFKDRKNGREARTTCLIVDAQSVKNTDTAEEKGL